jgi:hypothetical protein
MKLFSFLPIAALLCAAACASNDIIEDNDTPKVPIGFSLQVEDGSGETRALDMTTFNTFYVYGSYRTTNWDNNNIFNGKQVSKIADNTWDYENHQYWKEGAYYQFSAFSADNDDTINGKAGIINYWSNSKSRNVYTLGLTDFVCDENNQRDVIYAVTDEILGLSKGRNEIVSLTFQHILSRVKISFTNQTSNTLTFKNIKISNYYTKGQYSTHAIYTNGKSIDGAEWYNLEAGSRSSAIINFKVNKAATADVAKGKSCTTDAIYVLPYNYSSTDKYDWNAVKLYFETTDKTTGETNAYSSNFWPNWKQGYLQTYKIVITAASATLTD